MIRGLQAAPGRREGWDGTMIVTPDGPKWTARSYVKVRGEGRRWSWDPNPLQTCHRSGLSISDRIT